VRVALTRGWNVLFLFSGAAIAATSYVRTLEDVGKGKLAFQVRCLRRRHKALLMPLSLAMRFGVNFPVEAMYRRLKCTRCGARSDYVDVTLVGR
jgi:hypothetical protein